jgi:hypothetical protein
MTNGETMRVFDEVEVELGEPIPMKHHTENLEFPSGTIIKFVKKLAEEEQVKLLEEIKETDILNDLESKYELHEKIVSLGRSILLVGPIKEFGVESGNHPHIWFTKHGNSSFYLPCTDPEFSKFVKNKFDNSGGTNYIKSWENNEMKEKQFYFVLGLTGDSLYENGKIRDGRYKPDGTTMEARYWPMVISVLTIPNYF